jgi:hypothetical protein
MPVSALFAESRHPSLSLEILLLVVGNLPFLLLEKLIPLEWIFGAGLRLHPSQLDPLVEGILLLHNARLDLAFDHIKSHLSIFDDVFYFLPVFGGTFD